MQSTETLSSKESPKIGTAASQNARHINPVYADSTGHSPQPALLTKKQTAKLLGVSERGLHDLRAKASWLPLPIELGPRQLRWSRDELLAAVAQLAPRRAVQAEPPQLLRQRIERLKGNAA